MTDRKRVRLSIWTLVVVAVGAGVGGAVLGRVLPPFVVDGNWWGTFFTSPGFGGVAAVGAATIAFFAASSSSKRSSGSANRDRQQRVDDASADRDQRDAADQRSQWWSRFTWAADRAVNKETSELGVSVLLELIDQEWATTDDQNIAIAVADVITGEKSPEISEVAGGSSD